MVHSLWHWLLTDKRLCPRLTSPQCSPRPQARTSRRGSTMCSSSAAATSRWCRCQRARVSPLLSHELLDVNVLHLIFYIRVNGVSICAAAGILPAPRLHRPFPNRLRLSAYSEFLLSVECTDEFRCSASQVSSCRSSKRRPRGPPPEWLRSCCRGTRPLGRARCGAVLCL